MAAITGAAIAAGGAAYASNKNSKTQKAIAKQNSPTNQANAQAAITNTNQYTPYGSSVWNIVGQNPDGTNIYENRQSLSPEMQKQFDWGNKNAESSLGAQNNYLGQINDNSKNPLSASSLSGKIDYGTGAEGAKKYADSLSYGAGDAATMSDYQPVSASTYSPSTYDGKGYNAKTYDARELGQAALAEAVNAGTERAAYGKIQDNLKLSGDALKSDLDTTRDAYYNQQKAYLDPQWENDTRAMETKLANQGIAMNSAAYNDAMAAFNRNREFAYNNARNTSITGAGAEQSRLFGLDLEAGRFANAAQKQGFDQSAFNAEQSNNASIANARMGTDVNINNANAQNQNRQFNANNYNDAQRYNADSMNDAVRYSADATNRSNEYNTGAMNDASRYGADANNEMSQFNASMAADRDRFNAGAQNDFSQFNANLNNSAQNNAYNARLAAAEQNNNARNQEMEQLFAFRNRPVDEYNSLRQGTTMPMPNFDNGGGSNFNVAQAMQNSAQQQMYNANNQAQGNAAMWGQIGNITGMGIDAWNNNKNAKYDKWASEAAWD
jgi:hypothetical protein